jgi:8-oxo-dGTP diphosphatase
MKEMTACLLVRGQPPAEVLLGFKKVGFGAGKYAGFGGKIRPSESPSRAAARELQEEAGICVAERDLRLVGVLHFVFPARPSWSQIVHVFLTRAWDGEAVESSEMIPAWFPVETIPFGRMWQDSAYWLPCILRGECLRGRFEFAEDNETIDRVEIGPWDGVD